MSETNPPRRIGRSIAAVLVGMIVGIVATIGTDIVLHQIGVFPPWGASLIGYDGALGLATLYRAIYGIAASYIIARLAPNRPMQHALIGGLLGLVVGLWVPWSLGTKDRHSGLTGIQSRSLCLQYRKPGWAANSTPCS